MYVIDLIVIYIDLNYVICNNVKKHSNKIWNYLTHKSKIDKTLRKEFCFYSEEEFFFF